MKDPSKYDWINLQEDEEILFWEHPSIVPVLFTVVIGVLISLVGIYAAYNSPLGYVALLAIPVGMIVAASEYIRRLFIHYIITNNRVIKKTNIIRLDPEELDFEDVDSIDPTQGKDGIWNAIIERAFGYGDFVINTTGGKSIVFNNVSSWSEYHEELSRLNSMNSIREVMKKHAGKDFDENYDKNENESDDPIA